MEALTNGKVRTQSKIQKQLYCRLWRWHFYAGVFAIPFVLLLSVTGALYLFKPQLDAIHDAPYRNLIITGDLATPEQQVAAALAAVPNAQFSAYELARETTDAASILLHQAGEKIRVYIHPQTLNVLTIENESSRFLHIVHDLHGELLLGDVGSVVVELAACWAIVLVLTGVYLWWPRNAQGVAGILYPRFRLTGRLFWRDLHSVIGIWVSLLVLFLLLSGLPWTFVWGNAFKEFRQLTGTTAAQDWVIAGQKKSTEVSGEHAEHQQHNSGSATAELNSIVTKAQELHFYHPVLITPPPPGATDWAVKSTTQNRPLRAEATFNSQTGELHSLTTFAQRHVIDRVVGIGVAAHEGQLFGWLNQLLGLLVALSLITMSISGFIMWRKRAPAGVLGAPPPMPEAKIGTGFVAIIFVAAIFLPVLGASLITLLLIELLLLQRLASTKKWLGLA